MRNRDFGIPAMFWVIWAAGAVFSLGTVGFLCWLAWMLVNWLVHKH
jgi:hypothetical protein